MKARLIGVGDERGRGTVPPPPHPPNADLRIRANFGQNSGKFGHYIHRNPHETNIIFGQSQAATGGMIAIEGLTNCLIHTD